MWSACVEQGISNSHTNKKRFWGCLVGQIGTGKTSHPGSIPGVSINFHHIKCGLLVLNRGSQTATQIKRGSGDALLVRSELEKPVTQVQFLVCPLIFITLNVVCLC